MAGVVGYSGSLIFDSNKPDGAPRKLMNIDKLAALGWTYSIKLKAGLADTYGDYLECHQS
jgi:GDP-L-fucose synthase